MTKNYRRVMTQFCGNELQEWAEFERGAGNGNKYIHARESYADPPGSQLAPLRHTEYVRLFFQHLHWKDKLK